MSAWNVCLCVCVSVRGAVLFEDLYTATPRRTEPTWWLVYTAEWDSHEDMMAALQDPVMMEASKHAMGLLQKYGNTAEMMLGGPA